MKRELPPTDGLPLTLSDLCAPPGDLAAQLSTLLAIPRPLLTCSGTAALVVSLRALRRRYPQRSRVIVGAWSCPLVPLAASACPGIDIVLCDLAPDSLDLDSEMLERLCAEHTPPLAIIVTHLGGRVSALDPALAVAKRYDCPVIEDAAQALGARFRGTSLGLHGDIGFFSLAFGKGLTSGEGGVLFSRDPTLQQALAQEAASTLPYLRGWELRRSLELIGFATFYNPVGLRAVYGRPLRRALQHGDVVAAVGDDFTEHDIPLHQLGQWRQRVAAHAAKRLPDYWLNGKTRALPRCEQLAALPGVTVFGDRSEEDGVWPFITLLMPNPATRNAALKILWGAGLGVTRLFVHALSDYPAVKPWLTAPYGVHYGRDIANRSLTITNTHWLTDAEFTFIVTTLAQCLKA